MQILQTDNWNLVMNRKLLLVLLIIFSVAFVFLLFSLDSFTIVQPARYGNGADARPTTDNLATANDHIPGIYIAWLALLLIALIVTLVSLFLAPEYRKQFLAFAAGFLGLILIFSIARALAKPESGVLSDVPEQILGDARDRGGINSPQYDPQLFNILLVAGAAGSAALLYALIRRLKRTSPTEDSSSTRLLSGEGVETSRKLRRENEIVRCYLDMLDLVSVAGALEINYTRTASEILRFLHHKGYTGREYALLTQLFEKTRYGNEPAGVEDIARAGDFLEKIKAELEGRDEK